MISVMSKDPYMVLCIFLVLKLVLTQHPQEGKHGQDSEVNESSPPSLSSNVSSYYSMGVKTKGFVFIQQMISESSSGRKPKSSSNVNNTDSLYQKFGVYSEELEQPLLLGRNKNLECEVLFATPHGRHLLLISLLEHLELPCWIPRCEGKLRLYLPDSLKSSSQPPRPTTTGSCLLDDVKVDGVVQSRETVKKKLNNIVPENEDFRIFSWNKRNHRLAMERLLDLILDTKSFQESISLLVTLKDWLSLTMYVELVNLVAVGRNDTGFIMPSMVSYIPSAFISHDQLEYASNISVSNIIKSRQKRQARWPPSGRPGPWVSDASESYFREDTVANSHHSEWHRLSFGQRRGEYFYYMHGQMQARYEAERLCLGLPALVYFGPREWDRYISDSYDPRLGWTWSPRLPGTVDSWPLHGGYNEMLAMANSAPFYQAGQDFGIGNYASIFEEGLHNDGHMAISALSRGQGVMSSTVVALRDPIFFRWHGFVQSMFLLYKDNLNRRNPYNEHDLGFPGVRVGSAFIQPNHGANNTFYTCREATEVRVDSLDGTMPGSRMSVQYRRLNHRPFTFNHVIHNELNYPIGAVVRVFILPRDGNIRTTIHLDHFYHVLQPGTNYIRRDELEAPHLSKSRWSLNQLQNRLMNGQVNRWEFSWGGCGWPRHLNIPRGTERGMDWDLVVMVSQQLPVDRARVREWTMQRNLAWGYCGVQRGVVPDSRPLGFPVDRSFTNIQTLSGGRPNWMITPVVIRHGQC